jgi:hypothetical protein
LLDLATIRREGGKRGLKTGPKERIRKRGLDIYKEAFSLKERIRKRGLAFYMSNGMFLERSKI